MAKFRLRNGAGAETVGLLAGAQTIAVGSTALPGTVHVNGAIGNDVIIAGVDGSVTCSSVVVRTAGGGVGLLQRIVELEATITALQAAVTALQAALSTHQATPDAHNS